MKVMKHNPIQFLSLSILALILVGCGQLINHAIGITDITNYTDNQLRDIATNALASVSSPTNLAGDCAILVDAAQTAAAGVDRGTRGLNRYFFEDFPEWAKTADLRSFSEKLPNVHEFVVLPRDPAKDLPAFIWMRFGSHSNYAWLLIFPSAPAPHPFLSSCEKLSDTLYLSLSFVPF